jgi:hypothetical protein
MFADRIDGFSPGEERPLLLVVDDVKEAEE